MFFGYSIHPLRCKLPVSSVCHNKRNISFLQQRYAEHVLSKQLNNPRSLTSTQHICRLHQDVAVAPQEPRPHQLLLTSRTSSIEKEIEKEGDDSICQEFIKVTKGHELLDKVSEHGVLTPLQTYVAGTKLIEITYGDLRRQYSWLGQNDAFAYVQLTCNGNLQGEIVVVAKNGTFNEKSRMIQFGLLGLPFLKTSYTYTFAYMILIERVKEY